MFEFWGLNPKLKYTIYNFYSRQKFLVCYLDFGCIHSTIYTCVQHNTNMLPKLYKTHEIVCIFSQITQATRQVEKRN